MLHVTNNTMKKSALTILVLLILSTIGCGDAYKANKITHEETDTPLACDRENNQYYDFIDTKQCIRPTTYEQLYVLDKFRRMNELAAEDPEKTIEIQINFKHYPTAEEFKAIIDESVERVTYIGMFYPNFANGSGFPTYIRDESITKEQAFQHVMDKNMASAVQLGLEELMIESYGEFNDTMLDGYQIQGARLTMKQGDIADWWLKHISLIRVIQTIISDFDHVQTIFKPDEKVGPEDQSIDWEGVENE